MHIAEINDTEVYFYLEQSSGDYEYKGSRDSPGSKSIRVDYLDNVYVLAKADSGLAWFDDPVVEFTATAEVYSDSNVALIVGVVIGVICFLVICISATVGCIIWG